MGGEWKSRGRSLSPTHAACMARQRGGADALLVARTHPSALRSQRHPHHPRHPLLTTTGGRAPSPTDGARIRHGAFASDTVYTHATPRGGAWDSLPGRLRAPRLAPEPSRDTAGRPLRSTPPHTGDALALKALHPWRDARPAHTEGHVAAGPACPAGTRFLPRGCRPRPARPRPAGHAHTCTIVRRVRLPSQTATTPWPLSATRGKPLIRRPSLRSAPTALSLPRAHGYRLGPRPALPLQAQTRMAGCGAGIWSVPLHPPAQLPAEVRPGRHGLEASSFAWRPRRPLDRGDCRGGIS